MALTNDVLIEKFPIEPRAGWRKVLNGPGATEQRTYNDEPVMFFNGQLTTAQFTINCKVTPWEATKLAQLCSRANGRPFLFRDPWDFTATTRPVVSPYGDFHYGGVIRTGFQRCPIKVRGLTSPDNTRRLYVKPLFYVERLVIGETPTDFDPFERLEYRALGDLTVGADFAPASFHFWIPVRVTSLDIETRFDPNKTIAIGPACDDGDLVSIAVSLQESYDWLVDDAFTDTAFSIGIAAPPAFLGGQCPTVYDQPVTLSSSGIQGTLNRTLRWSGPISNIIQVSFSGGSEMFRAIDSITGAVKNVDTRGGTISPIGSPYSIISLGTPVPVDGSSDNCGDPPSTEPPLFFGGQCPVEYTQPVLLSTDGGAGAFARTLTWTGPVKGFVQLSDTGDANMFEAVDSVTGAQKAATLSGGTLPSDRAPYALQLLGTPERVDNLADNCGNPPP